MPGTDSAVLVDNITKSFGDVAALRGVSFEAKKGQVLGILGPNGAGKTTIVSVLATLLRPDSGYAYVAGHNVATEAPAVRRSIMLTGQQAALENSLSGRDNLVFFGRMLGLDRAAAKARAQVLLEEFDLVDAAERRVREYSGGMRRRIDIACGLMVRPEVVFLDEPTTGLDPRSRQGVWDLIKRLKDEGITTLLTTQYLEEADILSDNIIVIDKGTVIEEGTADQLKARTGTSYCEVVPSDPSTLPQIESILADMTPHGQHADVQLDRISVPAPNGPATLAEVIRRLDEAQIALADIGLRRPSLDDVFLALTGDVSS